MIGLDLPAQRACGRDELAATGELIEIFDDDVGIENDLAIVEDQHRQLFQGRDLRILVIGLSRRDGGREELDTVDQAELDRRDAHLARERRGRGEGEFHRMSFADSRVIPGRYEAIEPGISSFRVWSFGPSRNDEHRAGLLMLARAVTASRRDNLLPLFAERLYAERHHVPDIEVLRRLHAGAYTGRRARGDDVAGQQRHELRDVGNALGHREDHGTGGAGLAALAVDVEPHRQLLHVGYFVPGDEPGTERAEGVVRLALGPLTETLDLEVALGNVVADAVARDVIERVGLADIFGAGADDGGDLDFPVELGRAARLLHGIVGAGERGIGLEEEDRLRGNRIAGLLGVVGVVQTDGDELRDAGDGGAEPRRARYGGKRRRVEGGELRQRRRRVGLAVEVPDMSRKVAQLTGFIDQTGLFVPLGAVPNKLHLMSLPGAWYSSFSASWNSAPGNSTAGLHCSPARADPG